MNVGELREFCQAAYCDPKGTGRKPAEWLVLFNHAKRKLEKKVPVNEATWDQTLAAGDSMMAMSAPVIERPPPQIYTAEGRPLDRKGTAEISPAPAVGTPSRYAVEGRNFIFGSIAPADIPYKVRGARFSPPLTGDGDEPPWAPEYHEYIAFEALGIVFNSDGNKESGAYWHAEADDIRRMAATGSFIRHDVPRGREDR